MSGENAQSPIAVKPRAKGDATRKFIAKANKSLFALYAKYPDDLSIAYGLDCHQQLIHAPFSLNVFKVLLASKTDDLADFITYIARGRSDRNAPLEGLRNSAIGLAFLLDGFFTMFDGTLDGDDDDFARAYEDVLISLDRKIGFDGNSLMDVVPLSPPLYRIFVMENISNELFQTWAIARVNTVRLAISAWISV